MRPAIAILIPAFAFALIVSAVTPVAAANSPADPRLYAKCKAASFARRGPGTLSNAMRDAEINRCVKNNGFLD
jgi:hypothetical protein